MITRTIAKLVRDKIPQICEAENQTPCFYKIVNDGDFLKHLQNKLHEETEEMINALSVDEAADILEVLLTIGAIKGYTQDDLLEATEEKRAKKGGFMQRIFLHSVQDKNK